ncbi:MAG TPA: sigma 54-interacting transcriptional regulator [Syntrophomonadaceae bacterium]|nr:sigma 54-interacting transcriptional regulator [Syntrophomonadaceae bacterium]HPU49453.1 sigma 54-interacting transcriptional regulator [Syntrophomonadaceae bacterium]
MSDLNMELEDFLEIINSLSDAVVVYDADLKVVFVNEKLFEYGRLSKEDVNVIGTTPAQWLEEGWILNSIVHEVLDKKQEVTGTIRTKHGYFSSRCRPIFDKNGNVQYIVSTASSLTEINALQDMLQKQAEQSERYLREVQQLRQELLNKEFIYASKDMEQLAETIRKVAPIDCNVLITGESGVGKDVIAQTIHMNSPRKDGPFLTVNIPAIPEHLLEAELFGYEEGSFTGAVKGGKMGLFEVAKGGTILLDEIGDMPYNLQVKILRAIESGEIMRLGATKTVKLDVRILAATNRDIHEAIAQGRFRNDLYYRLNVVTLHVKPLRERIEDIHPLCQHFLRHFNEKYGRQKRFNVSAITELESYSWPGNVRELKNTVERLCILSEGDCITAHDVRELLDLKAHQARQRSEHHQRESNAEHNQSLSGRKIEDLFSDYQKQQILTALKKTNGNKTEAARLLGISRGKLYRLLRQY